MNFINCYFLRAVFFFLLWLFLLLGSIIHSSRSEVSRPPKPTKIKMIGQRFQKVSGKRPTLEAIKIKPIITKVAGQKTLLGINSLYIYLLSSIKKQI